MIKRSIYIVDKLVNGYNHVTFNAAITAIVAGVYNNDDVIFISESVHAGLIEKKNSLIINLKYQPYIEKLLPANKVKRLIPWVKKKIGDMFFLNTLYQAQFKNAATVFFTCLSTTSLLYAGYKAKRLKIPVFFFLHGEIEFIFVKNTGLLNQLRGAFYKLFLNQTGKTTKIFVLSELIKASLVEANYLPEDKIIVIEHPITPIDENRKKVSGTKLIFGHIGIAVTKKSSALFFELAKLNKPEVENRQVEFQLIGKIESALLAEDTSAVKVLSENNKSLTQDEYEQGITNADYAIFTFNEDNYVYRASGSVMDAIAFTKPIIALKHSYFNHLFKISGNIGFLCDDIAEMDLLVKKLVRKDESLSSQYSIQQNNLKQLMQKHSVAEVQNILSIIIES